MWFISDSENKVEEALYYECTIYSDSNDIYCKAFNLPEYRILLEMNGSSELLTPIGEAHNIDCVYYIYKSELLNTYLVNDLDNPSNYIDSSDKTIYLSECHLLFNNIYVDTANNIFNTNSKEIYSLYSVLGISDPFHNNRYLLINNDKYPKKKADGKTKYVKVYSIFDTEDMKYVDRQGDSGPSDYDDIFYIDNYLEYFTPEDISVSENGDNYEIINPKMTYPSNSHYYLGGDFVYDDYYYNFELDNGTVYSSLEEDDEEFE